MTERVNRKVEETVSHSDEKDRKGRLKKQNAEPWSTEKSQLYSLRHSINHLVKKRLPISFRNIVLLLEIDTQLGEAGIGWKRVCPLDYDMAELILKAAKSPEEIQEELLPDLQAYSEYVATRFLFIGQRKQVIKDRQPLKIGYPRFGPKTK